MFGRPSAFMAMLQYSLRVCRLPWHFKWSYKNSSASSVLDSSMLDLTSSVMTPLRLSLSRLCLGLTHSKKSSSCFLRKVVTENGAAAMREAVQ